MEKRVQLGGQFATEAGDFGDGFAGCGAELLDVAKMSEQRRPADGTEPRKIIEHALADFTRTEIGVVGVGEAVGFVAQALEQVERG